MKIEIRKNDIIYPLFTEELRTHLQTKLHKERTDSQTKMKEDGWGVTKFGDPNPEFYGDGGRWFWNHFAHTILTKEMELFPHLKVKPNGKAFMRTTEVIDGKFKLLPFPNIMDDRCFKYFKDFEFSVDGLGKDFYLMGVGVGNFY